MENLVPTLEAIKGSGRSIKVGTTGKISAFVRIRIYEILSSNTNLVKGISPLQFLYLLWFLKDRHEEHHQTKLAAATTRKALKMSEKPNTPTEKPTKYQRSLDGTPSRDKPDKRGSYVVAVVDLKCSNPDRTWAPITNRLKKLGSSKLSESSDQLSGSGNRI